MIAYGADALYHSVPMRKKNRSGSKSNRNAPSHSVEQIYGVHAVCAALSNPKRSVLELHTTKNGSDRLETVLGKLPVSPKDISPNDLSKRLGADAVHQGVMVEAAPLEQIQLADVAEDASLGKPLIILDQITDPHNVGAIMRSAAAFNACALIMTRRNSPPLDGTLAKAASGAVDSIPVILVANLARTLEELGKSGVQRIGLEGTSEQTLEAADLQHPLALVLGAEHKGLRRLTAENCDLLCRLKTPGPIKSLNVSNAAAVALHSVTTR
jgi:23S rRNA (guanosine2251-2'-O)-methyltransferase